MHVHLVNPSDFDDETEAVNSFFPGREIRRFDILEFVTQFKEGLAIELRKG
jgi:hypothetical protein